MLFLLVLVLGGGPNIKSNCAKFTSLINSVKTTSLLIQDCGNPIICELQPPGVYVVQGSGTLHDGIFVHKCGNTTITKYIFSQNLKLLNSEIQNFKLKTNYFAQKALQNTIKRMQEPDSMYIVSTCDGDPMHLVDLTCDWEKAKVIKIDFQNWYFAGTTGLQPKTLGALLRKFQLFSYLRLKHWQLDLARFIQRICFDLKIKTNEELLGRIEKVTGCRFFTQKSCYFQDETVHCN